MAKAKLDQQFGKFLKVLKEPYVNIPFTDILSQMPSYSKFLKEILSSKRKFVEHETMALLKSVVPRSKISSLLSLRIRITFIFLV